MRANPGVPQTGIRVLLIEDNADDIEVFRDALSLSGLGPVAIEVQGSVKMALVSLRKGPAPNIIVADMGLPDNRGPELVERLHIAFFGPIIILTGADDQKAGVESVRLGASDFLQKDRSTPDALGRAIAYALERHRFQVNAIELSALRRSEQLQRDFVANVSHELRTPLSVVLGCAETLRKGETDEAEKRKLVRIIENQGKRLNHLVENLLELSSAESGGGRQKFEPIHLRPFIRELLSNTIRTARKQGISIRFKIPHDLTAMADRSQLTQVIQNIFDNAVKYNRRNGCVSIEARKSKSETILAVTDTGMGIPQEDLAHVFDRFRRTRIAKLKFPKGSGLGLAIAKGIIETHGGRIWVESREGEGSTFHFSLPDRRPRSS